ncbi:hypothetical protein [Alicyclobacillus dauci]|uniref:Uncharacterized protein n=1 Tax=Alicyclobacillus dauci TaxID=1475485 RepID=A0ABY6Z3X8_9BACL|nr:hypothetical protein [Alicyclobacillus dauci]WAH37026.1 hypothetical protein NZD86_00115 [Alicyclobacillus dauci]
MPKDQQIPIDGNLTLEITRRKGTKSRAILIALVGEYDGFLLDYYDSAKDAEEAARHFKECYKVAVEAGFKVVERFFVLEDACRVSVAEGLAVEEPVEAFREVLRMLKAYQMPEKFLKRRQEQAALAACSMVLYCPSIF